MFYGDKDHRQTDANLHRRLIVQRKQGRARDKNRSIKKIIILRLLETIYFCDPYLKFCCELNRSRQKMGRNFFYKSGKFRIFYLTTLTYTKTIATAYLKRE